MGKKQTMNRSVQQKGPCSLGVLGHVDGVEERVDDELDRLGDCGRSRRWNSPNEERVRDKCHSSRGDGSRRRSRRRSLVEWIWDHSDGNQGLWLAAGTTGVS